MGYLWSMFLLLGFSFLGWTSHSILMHHRVNKMIEEWKPMEDEFESLDMLVKISRLI